jgi:hypothetical protein
LTGDVITLLIVVDVEFTFSVKKIEILRRLGVGTGRRSKKMVTIVVCFYAMPSFRVCDSCGIIVGWKESSVGRCV